MAMLNTYTRSAACGLQKRSSEQQPCRSRMSVCGNNGPQPNIEDIQYLYIAYICFQDIIKPLRPPVPSAVVYCRHNKFLTCSLDWMEL